MNISEFLKARRIELGIFQGELAKSLGWHKSTISRLETGKIEWKFRDVLKACEILGLSFAITKDEKNE